MFAGLMFRVLDYVISRIFKSLFFYHDVNKHGNNGTGSILRR